LADNRPAIAASIGLVSNNGKLDIDDTEDIDKMEKQQTNLFTNVV